MSENEREFVSELSFNALNTRILAVLMPLFAFCLQLVKGCVIIIKIAVSKGV